MAVDVTQLYSKYGPMVLRRCRRLLGDEEMALDAMQDTFVQVLRHQERLNCQAPSSLLYTIATNVCLNQMRSRRRKPVVRDEWLLEVAGPEASHEDKTVAAAVLDLLFSTEQESTRRIAVYHYLDGHTLEETAAFAGMSVSGVRKRLRVLRERSQVFREE